jgi:hypothetical protein
VRDARSVGRSSPQVICRLIRSGSAVAVRRDERRLTRTLPPQAAPVAALAADVDLLREQLADLRAQRAPAER